MKAFLLAAAAVGTLAASSAQAAPIVATHSVSGTSGNYTYSFTFSNNVGEGQNLYFIGLQDSAGSIVSMPTNFEEYPAYNFDGFDASLSWLDYSNIGIKSGETLGGFTIRDTSSTVKTSFNFAGYTDAGGNPYSGAETYYGRSDNPSFRFTSTAAVTAVTAVAAVPEPATWAMMLIGFGGIGATMRRRKTSARIQFA